MSEGFPIDRSYRRRFLRYALAESMIGLFKTELRRNPAALKTHGGPRRGLDDLEIATSRWVAWFNESRLHPEFADRTPAEVEQGYYRDLARRHRRLRQPTEHRASVKPRPVQQ